jgi:hypothetical protein
MVCRCRTPNGSTRTPSLTVASRLDLEVAFCYPDAMSQPVKLSDQLVLDARLAGKATERSIAGQVEFWAKLGRAIEPLIQGHRALALCRSSDATSLSAQVASVGTAAGRDRLEQHLAALPYPHYAAAPGSKGLLIRTEADGITTVGRFVNRVFKPAPKARTGR